MIKKEGIKKTIKEITDSIGLLCAWFVSSLSPVMLCDLGGDILIVCVSSMAHRSPGHFSFTCEATEPWRLHGRAHVTPRAKLAVVQVDWGESVV